MEPRICHLALGSNIGDRRAAIDAALDAIGNIDGVRLFDRAPIIETAAVTLPGSEPQGDYLNSACSIETTLDARDLLLALQRIERSLGRDRAAGEPWAPRTIDLDILLDGERIIDEPGLTVPHPRMHERRFVLEPLSAIASDAAHPALGRTVAELLGALGGATRSRPLAMAVLVLGAMLVALAPAIFASAQEPAVEPPPAELPEGVTEAALDADEVYRSIVEAHHAGPIADRVTIRAVSEFRRRDNTAIVRVDADSGAAMFELGRLTALVRDGDLRITHKQRGDRFALYEGDGRPIGELLEASLPPIPMPHIALAFEGAENPEHLTPFPGAIAWTNAIENEDGFIVLLGIGAGTTVSYIVDSQTRRLHTGVITVPNSKLRIEMGFEAMDPGDPALWALDLQGKKPVPALAQLQPGGVDIFPGAPAPPMAFFTLSSEPWQLETSHSGDIALLIFREISPAVLAARDALEAAIQESGKDIDVQPVLVTSRLVGIDLFERIGQTVHAYGEPVLWTASQEATINRFTTGPACIVLIDAERDVRTVVHVGQRSARAAEAERITRAIEEFTPSQ